MDKQLVSKKLLGILGLLTIAQGISIILSAIYLSRAITNLFEGAASNAVLPFFLMFVLFLVIRYVLQWIKERISYRFAEKKSLQTQKLLIEKLFILGPSRIRKNGSGHVITLCLEGISNFRTYLELFIPRAVSMICIPIILLIYIFTVDFLSGVVMLVTMPIMIAFLILLGLLAQKKITAQLDTYQVLSNHFVDSLRGLVTLKFLGKSKSHVRAIESVSEKYRSATMRTLRLAFLSTFALDFFSSLSVAVVAVELGLRLIEGNIGLEAALMILILAPEYFLPIRSFGNDYHATMNGKEAGEQIQELLNEDAPVKQKEEESLPLWNENSSLFIKDLQKSFEDDERLILKNLTFQINGYQKIGIVGHSGAGKSTLIDILAGFSDGYEGRVFYNDNPLGSFRTEGWQKQVTYIPQHPYIFSATIAENISWYAPEASEIAIQGAAERAGLSELIDSLPKGLDEKIGQGGRSLSGGEEQRIALARSLLQNRPIMLFDEPTAHLDIETEYDLKKLLIPQLENKLVFFATHRLHWMKEMDLIFVLEDGSLVEAGTHEELYRKKGNYYRLISALKGEKDRGVLSNLC